MDLGPLMNKQTAYLKEKAQIREMVILNSPPTQYAHTPYGMRAA